MTRGRLPGFLVLLAALLSPSPATAAEWATLGETPATGRGVFRFPQALTYSPGGGKLFVGDQFSGVVQRFSRDGTWEADIGWYADDRELGRIGVLGGLAADRDGHLFVLDSENDRVQVFGAGDGRWLAAWGTRGSEAGRFALGRNTGAGGIAIDQSAAGAPATIYVADQNNHRIQAFVLSEVTPDGERVLPPGARDRAQADVVPVPIPARRWGRFGSCAATGCADAGDREVLDHPQGVAVDPGTSDVFVADDRNHRVVRYRPDGSYVSQVGSFGRGPGQFRFPYDVGVDGREPRQLYVADNNNHRVQTFDAASLAFVGGWGGFGPEPGNLEFPRALGAVADDPAGGVAVADTANNRVQVFAPDGRLVSHWGIAGRGPGYVTRPGGVAVDGQGQVHVADTLASRVQRLNADGTYAGQTGYISARSGFAAPAAGDSQFDEPEGIAVDAAGGRVWVADTDNGRVQELALDGTWIATHAGLGFRLPRAVAVAPDGSVLVADTGNHRIQRRDPVTGAWSLLDTRTVLRSPAGVAVTQDGSTLVSDTGADRVLRVGVASTRVLPGAFSAPTGLAVHGDDLYVADTGASRVLRQDLVDGSRESLGGEGRVVGAFVAPRGVAVDPRGAVLVVADTGNDRLQRLALADDTTTEPRQLDVSVSGGGTVTSRPAGIACPTDCRQSFSGGSTVTLSALPDPGAVFAGWGGPCAGTGDCTVRMDIATAVTAAFAPAPPPAPAAPAPAPTAATPVPAPSAARVDRTPPRLSGVRVSPARVRPSARGGLLDRRRWPGAARLRLRLSEPATLHATVAGRRGATRIALRRGRARLWLTGRVGGRTLQRGTYRLVLQATDAAGNSSPRVRRSFRVR